jgi:predicted outer membrane repeat protein
MSRSQEGRGDRDQPAVRSTRRRSRWLVTGGLVAGALIAEAAGFAGVAAAVDRGDPAGYGGSREVEFVPCDPDWLVGAIARANAEGGANLRLASGCTYTLTAVNGSAPAGGPPSGGAPGSGPPSDAVDNPVPAGNLGLPLIHQQVTIDGAGATITRDSNSEDFSFFYVLNGGALTLRDVTLSNGRAPEGGSIEIEHGGTVVLEDTTITKSVATFATGGGGAVFNDGHLAASESRFTDNSAAGAAGKGGGILNGGVLTVQGSEFSNNTAGGSGGGFANFQGAADLGESTFVDNRAPEGGGIASVSARTKVWDSTVAGNTATVVGGGIANRDAVITLDKLRVSNNTSATNGGGVSTAQGLLTVDDSTVEANTAEGNGGGIYAETSNLIVRRSDDSRNRAVGGDSKGGAVFVEKGQAAIFESRFVENSATEYAGGVFAKDVQVNIDDETLIDRNRPCTGGMETGECSA